MRILRRSLHDFTKAYVCAAYLCLPYQRYAICKHCYDDKVFNLSHVNRIDLQNMPTFRKVRQSRF